MCKMCSDSLVKMTFVTSLDDRKEFWGRDDCSLLSRITHSDPKEKKREREKERKREAKRRRERGKERKKQRKRRGKILHDFAIYSFSTSLLSFIFVHERHGRGNVSPFVLLPFLLVFSHHHLVVSLSGNREFHCMYRPFITSAWQKVYHSLCWCEEQGNNDQRDVKSRGKVLLFVAEENSVGTPLYYCVTRCCVQHLKQRLVLTKGREYLRTSYFIELQDTAVCLIICTIQSMLPSDSWNRLQ